MPLLSTYHERIEAALHERGINAPFRIMRSSGGLAQAQEISDLPIAAALSGPAAGVVAATHYAQLAGSANVITLDMGGTSTDICLVEEGTPRMLTEVKVGIYDVKTPMIDLHTVGAGGGSIAWMAGGRSLRVGPQSSGSTPGPACYRRGGTEATVTDANIVRIRERLTRGGIALDQVRLKQFADVRYAGQGYELRVPLVARERDDTLADAIAKAIATFHANHRDLYGYSYEGREAAELVNIGATGLCLIKRPPVPQLRAGGPAAGAALKAQRVCTSTKAARPPTVRYMPAT
jgi:N-methylhydantoinase A/oxoprolinase/acetone carboxylase beta subunit